MTADDPQALPEAVPPGVLAAWSSLRGRPQARIAVGNINRTFRVEGAEGPVIVQRLHPVFAPEVHHDIEAVTAHLEAKGLNTPRLIPTDAGELWTTGEEGAPWRAQTFVEGECVEKVDSPARAEEGGRLIGRFHRALADLEHQYRFTRGNVHDTAGHLQTLAEALAERGEHRLFDEVAPLAERVLAAGEALPDFGGLAPRHAHGDLKISNLMFDDDGRASCLIDLDTVSLMIWPFEVGDALRSWCNPQPEDVRPARFDAALFDAALSGYAQTARDLPTDDERALLVGGVQTICLELSARFLADALREAYFGYDETRYPGPGEHHLARGRAMKELADSVDAQRAELEETVARRLG